MWRQRRGLQKPTLRLERTGDEEKIFFFFFSNTISHREWRERGTTGFVVDSRLISPSGLQSEERRNVLIDPSDAIDSDALSIRPGNEISSNVGSKAYANCAQHTTTVAVFSSFFFFFKLLSTAALHKWEPWGPWVDFSGIKHWHLCNFQISRQSYKQPFRMAKCGRVVCVVVVEELTPLSRIVEHSRV